MLVTSRYKLSSAEEAECHGPFSAAQMQSWLEQGYFAQKPVWVRRCQQLDPSLPGFGEPAEAFRSSETVECFTL
eukprot:COSAG01_NODE_1139_length_11544_cov_249.103801_6_plen_74_part_00